MNENVCSQCEATGKLENLYGFYFCARCESKLGLYTDKTILKNAQKFAAANPTSCEEEVVRRLQRMERDFVKTKVKLLHILERLTDRT